MLRFMLEKAWISGKGLLLEIWMLKAILVGCQAEIRNGRKGDLCYKVAKSLGELCSGVLWKVEFAKRWHCILAEEISKPGVETLGSSWQLIVKGERREMN